MRFGRTAFARMRRARQGADKADQRSPGQARQPDRQDKLEKPTADKGPDSQTPGSRRGDRPTAAFQDNRQASKTAASSWLGCLDCTMFCFWLLWCVSAVLDLAFVILCASSGRAQAAAREVSTSGGVARSLITWPSETWMARGGWAMRLAAAVAFVFFRSASSRPCCRCYRCWRRRRGIACTSSILLRTLSAGGGTDFSAAGKKEKTCSSTGRPSYDPGPLAITGRVGRARRFSHLLGILASPLLASAIEDWRFLTPTAAARRSGAGAA